MIVRRIPVSTERRAAGSRDTECKDTENREPEWETGQAYLTAYLRDGLKSQPGRRRGAVIICPGGAYERCSDREGEPVAMAFLAMGLQAFVLNYSTAPARFPAALRELARAVSIVRSHEKEWGIDGGRVAVCGFSAGGHLAASLGVFWNRKELWEACACEEAGESGICQAVGKAGAAETAETAGKRIRPDRLILCYPVITSGSFGHLPSFRNLLGERYEEEQARREVSLEYQAGPQVPPVFLWHTDEDKTVPAENSLLFAMALRKAGVSLEYHLFPKGRHGLSLASPDSGKEGEPDYVVPCCQQWIPLVKEWLKDFI